MFIFSLKCIVKKIYINCVYTSDHWIMNSAISLEFIHDLINLKSK